jgi:hypothetical protein
VESRWVVNALIWVEYAADHTGGIAPIKEPEARSPFGSLASKDPSWHLFASLSYFPSREGHCIILGEALLLTHGAMEFFQGKNVSGFWS